MQAQALWITGGNRLEGEVSISGAKNAALPMIIAACLSEDGVTLTNVPVALRDIEVVIELMRALGAEIQVEGRTLRLRRAGLSVSRIPAELAHQIRSSILLLSVAAALGEDAFLPLPGGCPIGERGVDIHIEGLRALGARIEETEEGIQVYGGALKGTDFTLRLPSTTATQNIMIAACYAQGRTTIQNSHTRPENIELAELLKAMNGRITVRKRVIEVEGTGGLGGSCSRAVMPGWDEATAYMVGAGITGGDIILRDYDLRYSSWECRALSDAGVRIEKLEDAVRAWRPGELQPFDIFTAPYPGINSDMQPIFAAIALFARGESSITDTRFENRFQYVEEMRRFGADITQYGNTAIVQGGKALRPAEVTSPDLRGGAALALTALGIVGRSRVRNAIQIYRGYENFDEKLRRLGATVEVEI